MTEKAPLIRVEWKDHIHLAGTRFVIAERTSGGWKF
jgi:hypothetical protein